MDINDTLVADIKCMIEKPELVRWFDSRLYTKAKPIPPFQIEEHAQHIQKAANELARRMLFEHDSAVGLAATQVGLMWSLAAAKQNDLVHLMINPTIKILSSNTHCLTEGCLSYPGIRLDVERPSKIEVTYTSAVKRNYGEVVTFQVDVNEITCATMDSWLHERLNSKSDQGLWIHVLWHELDHLNGITFLQRATYNSRQERRKIERELRKIPGFQKLEAIAYE